MYNQQAYEMGDNRCVIRDIAEYGAVRAQEVGAENVFNFTIGNPSLPAPAEITQAVADVMQEMGALRTHSYTSAQGDLSARKAIAEDLNNRFGTDVTPAELFVGCGPFEPAAKALLQPLDFLWRLVAGQNDLLSGVMKLVEGVKKLLLGAFPSGNELNIVNHQDVHLADPVPELKGFLL